MKSQAEPGYLHLHLDPVGGIAGDMFAAALIDLDPALADELDQAFTTAGFSASVRLKYAEQRSHAVMGHRFGVEQLQQINHAEGHRAYRDIRALLEATPLQPSVLQHALAIFELLARAEGQVHGIAVDEVSFHEVGAWDSIADVVAAAWLIERFRDATWSCGPLPLGSGRVMTAHGTLPVPAPATTVLLEGYPVYQDGIEGERVTPTGAAILRHLSPSFEQSGSTMRLQGSGIGLGSQRLKGVSNILRVLAFEPVETAPSVEQVVVCEFEVDDQTPEDLAVALEKLRGVNGVMDVLHTTVCGKKGRLGAQVRALVRPEAQAMAVEHCFTETATLGVRWHVVQRAVLHREGDSLDVAGRRVRVKRARRPGGHITGKAEMDDVADAPGGRDGREGLRREAETLALRADAGDAQGKTDAEHD